MVGFGRRSEAVDALEVARLRETLRRGGRIRLAPRVGLVFVGAIFFLGCFLVLRDDPRRVVSSTFAGGLAVLSLITGIMSRHPVVIDQSGIRIAGRLGWCSHWGDIREAVVVTYGAAGQRVLLRVTPQSVASYARTRGRWFRLMSRIAISVEKTSFIVPPLSVNAETLAEFVNQEVNSRAAKPPAG